MHCQGKCCDNCICFSFSIQKKKIPDAHLICAQWSWVESGSVPHLHPVPACPPWPAQSRTCKGIGTRKKHQEAEQHGESQGAALSAASVLWGTVQGWNNGSPMELHLIYLIYSQWWMMGQRAADFGCTTLKYFIKDGKRPCASITQQILPFAL